MKIAVLAITVILLSGLCPVWAQLPADQIDDLAVTVYNGNYGIVREVRSLNVAADGSVRLSGVPTAIDPTTVSFKCLSAPRARLLEQNYQYDLVNTDSLLRRYIDREIEVVCEDGRYSGELMSFDNSQIILRGDNGIYMVQRADNIRDIRFDSLPQGLLTKPTLIWLLADAPSGKQTVEVSYQSSGLNWHAEYVLVLNADDTAGDMSGWVSVDNRSGRSYENARLKFIAGDVRRIAPVPPRAMRKGGYALSSIAPDSEAMVEKSFFEYHMYSLPRPSTVADNETKQLEMFEPAGNVKVSKRFLYNPHSKIRYYGGRNDNPGYGGNTGDKKVNVFVEFKNEKSAGLGIPLPAGKVRVFKKDPADSSMQFIGEERIDHTARKNEVSLEIGNAFDLSGTWRQVDFDVNHARHWMSEDIEVKLKNSKEDEDVVIRVKAPMHRGRNWKVKKDSAPEYYKKLDAFTSAWDIPVAAGKEVTLEFTVEYTW